MQNDGSLERLSSGEVKSHEFNSSNNGWWWDNGTPGPKEIEEKNVLKETVRVKKITLPLDSTELDFSHSKDVFGI